MKPYASISLDLDNQWSYMKTHGDAGWDAFPSYLDIFVPHALEALERNHLNITFFVVGQDAALEKNREALGLLTENGHEIGNHSFHHEVWFHHHSKEQIHAEILRAEAHIADATGQKPVGFRGPGFTWSDALFEVLAENGYLYDASTLPTWIGPLARLYFFRTSDLSEEEKRQREGIYGSLKDGLKPVSPYYWQLDSGERLLEIPVTTIPAIRSPFHLSYLLYLCRYSESLMSAYLNVAIGFCKMTGTEPSFLLHPLDLLGGDQVPDLAFFPGMDLSGERKGELFDKVIGRLATHFRLENMSSHAKHIVRQRNGRAVSL
ncbi:polysaccharide deacetylase [Desulfonema ishimotonii]|uniref:Polysaccharide deacetylase n=1 Tax=Desulfonema ishimotonii TaxID=45657 RepID=A0A401FVE4_9BACT|nr:polysaccharide deacetylase family protein [Desulfonema ishimotonii]GBC60936.1 polysaccharide deacetylase [Desulfonema ishimotonii]